MRKLVNYGVFYTIWIGMILGETYVWSTTGYILGLIVFSLGGVALATFHHHRTESGEKPFGWPLRVAKHVTVRHTNAGLVLNAFLNGAPGVGLVETSLGIPWQRVRARVVIASVGYAVLWCFIHYVRPHGVAPIYWHPSGAALIQVWRVIVG